jgi:hypothetical protein
VIVPLWNRHDHLPCGRLEAALELFPLHERGPYVAFASMVRRRAFRPYTIGISMLRVTR